MISCRDFIPAYSELFRALERLGGHAAVLDFWNYLSDRYLGNLKDLATRHGLRGCWLYWQQTLSEEAADFTMELDEEANFFRIVLHDCPSKRRLLSCEHIQSYHDYCGHCDVLYRRVLEPLGYAIAVERSERERATCNVIIRKKGI